MTARAANQYNQLKSFQGFSIHDIGMVWFDTGGALKRNLWRTKDELLTTRLYLIHKFKVTVPYQIANICEYNIRMKNLMREA
jgi:hypothetical protein